VPRVEVRIAGEYRGQLVWEARQLDFEHYMFVVAVKAQ
jgi:hypothetical protein